MSYHPSIKLLILEDDADDYLLIDRHFRRRRDDLLFRQQRCEWLLAMAAPLVESHRWFERAEEEFTKANRNRPFGPLPRFHAETRCQWPPGHPPSEIVRDFSLAADPHCVPLTTP